MKIISAVPSLTELLYHLGLDEEVVGITQFYTDPESWYQEKTRIGGPKKLNLERIQSLQPDWILASKEENIKEQIEYCATFANILLTDVCNYEDALAMIREVGKTFNREQEALNIHNNIQAAFSGLQKLKSQRVLYMIWKNPLMSVGGDSFIHDMLQRCGWDNVLGDKMRYPSFSETEMQELNPDIVFLSSEPYPFEDKHISYFQDLLPKAKIILVEGSYFTWYGSRMMQAPAYFQSIQAQINAD